MKTALYLTFFLLITTVKVYTQQGWFWQSPQPTGHDITDIFFIDSENGIAVTYSWNGSAGGGKGSILKTTNGGKSWITKFETLFGLNNIYFINPNIGWVVGGNGIILKTTDGGANWFNQYANTDNTLHRVSFIDTQNGWITPQYGFILKTTDGGDTWTRYDTKPWYIIYDFYFTDIFNGIAVGKDNSIDRFIILKTTNGGENWVSEFIEIQFSYIGDVFFSDFNLLWCVGSNGKIFKTSDGGKNWVQQNSGTDQYLFEINFTDVNNAWIVGGGGIILKTTDGGENWNHKVSGIEDDRRLRGIHFIGAQSGWIAGDNGTILKTNDTGENWFQISRNVTSEWLNQIDFIDEQNGWAVGSEGTIIKTTDGGENWLAQTSGTTLSVTDVSFTNSNYGLAVGFDFNNNTSIILKTTDGGNNWGIIYTGINKLKEVEFLNENKAIIVGEDDNSGIILQTTDGGNNWQQTDYNNGTISVFFIDANYGWVSGYGTILKTSDGGENWEEIQTGTNETITSISFINHNIGFALGFDGIFLKTTDGGENWAIYETGNSYLNSVSFIDENNGIAVGGVIASGGFGASSVCFILVTTDGGESWTEQTSPTTYPLNSVVYIASKTKIAVGGEGAIIKIIDQTTSTEETKFSTTPSDFSLYQNYPNPFNPKTSIEYRVASSEYVSLKVYDLLGREVATLVDEFKPAGRYEVAFDASHLSSGVYLYKLTADGFTDSKKLVLLK